jgi:hypothetical protein
MDRETERDRIHDRKRQIRDRLLCALEDAGRAMSPAELARITGLGICAVTIAAQNAPRYFVVTVDGKRTTGIDRHPHLKIGA